MSLSDKHEVDIAAVRAAERVARGYVQHASASVVLDRVPSLCDEVERLRDAIVTARAEVEALPAIGIGAVGPDGTIVALPGTAFDRAAVLAILDKAAR